MLPRLLLPRKQATHLLAGFGLVWRLIGIRESQAFQPPTAPVGHLRILPQRKASSPPSTTNPLFAGAGVPRTSSSSGAVGSRSRFVLFAKNATGGGDDQNSAERYSENMSNDKLEEEEDASTATGATATATAAAAAADHVGGAKMIARSSSRSSTTTRRTDRNVGGYDPSERLSPEREVNVGDPQLKVMEEKEFSVTSILRELAAIQQQGPRKYCILGTRHCSFLHQQIIELLYVFCCCVMG
jgi:hypothetical protein